MVPRVNLHASAGENLRNPNLRFPKVTCEKLLAPASKLRETSFLGVTAELFNLIYVPFKVVP